MNKFIMKRLLGIFPIAFFIWTIIENILLGTWYDIFWICNISNLVLGLGLLTASPMLIWISTLWLLPGIPLWIVDIFVIDEFLIRSVFTHIIGTSIGITSLFFYKKSSTYWYFCIVYFLILWIITRLITPLNVNVNISHEIYTPLKHIFGNYWIYLGINLITAGLFFFVIEKIITKLKDRKNVHE